MRKAMFGRTARLSMRPLTASVHRSVGEDRPLPRFSVIVPVYRVQGYLRECLDSILDQPFIDLEVIAVNDCSPDHSGEILSEYAARDHRVKVTHLSENVGLGKARNTGVSRATGDYLLFLDSDDTHAPGSLRAIDDRLRLTGFPDVLVFDHVRTSWKGRGGPSMTCDLLESSGTATFTIAENPEYLHLFLIACNKAIRRDFFVQHGFAFAPGLYEDAPVIYEVMARAKSIACLPRVCFEYRNRAGAITHTPGRQHFDIFDQYGRLLSRIDEDPELEPMRAALFERAVNHFLVTLPLGDRVRPEDRPDFYRRILEFYRRHAPAGFVPPRDELHAQFQLLALDSPYRLFQTVVSGRKQGAKVAKDIRAGAARKARRFTGRVGAARALDPHLAVYGTHNLGGVLGDPAAVHARAAELVPDIRGVWVVRPDVAEHVPAGCDYVVRGSRDYSRLVARATYFFNDGNWPGDVIKRPGAVWVQTHQGTPIKHMGTDLLRRPTVMPRHQVRSLLRQCDRWDYSLAANDHSHHVWDRAYPCHFTSLPTGSPRNDALVKAQPEHTAALRRRLGIPNDSTVVLYAPTTREYRKRYVPRIDLENLARQLGPSVTLLVRLHPRYRSDPYRQRELRDLRERGLLMDVCHEPGAPSVEDLMLVSDVLVSDYSSLLFDYALLDRPIIVHADDWDTYQTTRGAYFDVREQAPGHVTTTTDELTKVLTSGAWLDNTSTERRASFHHAYPTFDDGQAAERVVRHILGHEELPPSHGLARIPAPGCGTAELSALR